MDVYVERSLGYVSRLEVACACRVGQVVIRELVEKACGVGRKEKIKDNGYMRIQKICGNSLVC